MSSEYIAAPLKPERIMQAYPLVQALAPGVTPARWREFAIEVLEDGSAHDTPRLGRWRIMTLQTAAGYLHALFIYQLRSDLRDGLCLDVAHMVTFELPGQSSALQTAIRVIEQIARDCGCRAVTVNVPAARSNGFTTTASMADAFGARGYTASATAWRKLLAAPVAETPATLQGR
ncbi:MAG TPA: hypothetical protein VE631_01485 [Alphaproteobacteria bacterium]|nr:hypothetical protein [Alphaproteobacteria bacterium]